MCLADYIVSKCSCFHFGVLWKRWLIVFSFIFLIFILCLICLLFYAYPTFQAYVQPIFHKLDSENIFKFTRGPIRSSPIELIQHGIFDQVCCSAMELPVHVVRFCWRNESWVCFNLKLNFFLRSSRVCWVQIFVWKHGLCGQKFIFLLVDWGWKTL